MESLIRSKEQLCSNNYKTAWTRTVLALVMANSVPDKNVRIREFNLSDYDRIVSLWLECDLITNRESISKEMLKIEIERNPKLFLVCEDPGGRIIGTVVGAWDGWRGWIYKLAVTKDCRRGGLASRLVKEVTSRLRQSGARIIRGYVKKENDASLSLFAKLGFTRMDDVVLVTLGRQ
jgi:ribosomal protein S18 acetylase RimI-like enzyme